VNAIELARLASTRALRRSIQVNNGQVVYFEYPALAANAETLIMIHGYRGNHRGLEAIAAGLSDFRILIPDLPGFGESEPLQEEHTVDSYSVWLHDFVKHLGLSNQLHLIGHSFGTLVVGHYATKYEIKSASFVNPVSTPALEGQRALLTAITKIYYGVASALPNLLGQWLLRSKLAVMVMSVVMAKSKDKALRRWIHLQHLNNFSDFASVPVAVEGYLASISTDLSRLAPKISAQVLVIAAELDDITDIVSQRQVAKTFPNAILREISGVGHLVHYEAPDQAALFINEFLKEL
jgi:pimeloyl-ACP methyl ester carboxylesterase